MRKTLLITGGSRGIGRAAAVMGATQGYNVVINYVGNESAASEAVTAVEAAGGEAIAVQGDVAVEADVIALFDAAQTKFGGIDAVVVNAGIVGEKATLADMPLERLTRILNINTLGALLTAREAARRLPPSRGGKGGAVVIVSSAAARLGSPGEYVDYASSKGALDTLTIGLAKELALESVRVNGVRPGIIETDIHASGGQPDRIARLGPQMPMRRAGTPDEVAAAILFLLSDAASYANGAIMDVSGAR